MDGCRVERQVADLYHRLWEKIDRIEGSEIVDQFLQNVGLPREWFRGKRSLDVGCGSGFAVWVMRHLGAQCQACDLAHESLRRVRARLGASRLGSGVPLLNASVLALPYRSESFDFVHCNGVLHHTIDPRRGFSELVRVTRPGGTVFVGLYGQGGLYNAVLLVARVFARLIPYRLTDTVAAIVLEGRRVPHSFMPARVSLLDNLYVPIRERFREREIRDWFRAAGFAESEVVRTKTTVFDHTNTLNRVIHGEGYIQLRGQKSD